jgi:hypothetical protein
MDVITINISNVPGPDNYGGSGSNEINQSLLFLASTGRLINKLVNKLIFRYQVPNWFKLIILFFIILVILLKFWTINIILLLLSNKFWFTYFFLGLSIAILDSV